MDEENFFRIAFALVAIMIISIRLYGHRKAETFTQEKRSYDEGWLTKVLRPITVVVVLSVVVYLVSPESMAWSSLDLPFWLRALSIPLSIIAIVLMAWVQQSLSKNFSGQLVIRDDHSLITTGPYRWVRHPMYTTVTLLFIAVFLMTANWFIGIGGLVMVLGVIIARTPREEAMLLETFGDDYANYMNSTPRYIPYLF